MIKEIFKKGGKKEKFDLEKIKKSLISAIERVNVSKEKKDEVFKETIKEILDYVKSKKIIFTSEIEAKIILKLEKLLPEAAIFWREYRREKEKIKNRENLF